MLPGSIWVWCLNKWDPVVERYVTDGVCHLCVIIHANIQLVIQGKVIKGWTNLGLTLQSLFSSTTFLRSRDPICFSHHTVATSCKLISDAHNAYTVNG